MKIFVGVVLVLLILVCVFLAGARSMFGPQIKAAGSVRKMADDLYFMEYTGDYGFDEFLKLGGADSDAKMAEYISTFLSHGFIKKGTTVETKDFGCSSLSVSGPAGETLFGRNYDWQKCNAMIVHTNPQSGYESFSTCCLDFLGFGEGWKPEGFANRYMSLAAIYVPLDGMNEKGLCVADLVCGDDAQTHQNTGKPDLTIVSAIRLLLDKAASVDEAIALLSQYDLNSSIGTSHHLALCDTSGKSVVVEYINNEMFVTETAIVTNHYLTAGEKQGVGNEESHARYDRLARMHTEANGTMTADALKECMKKVSYPDLTQWSIVYDPGEHTLDFYWQRAYEMPQHFKLSKK